MSYILKCTDDLTIYSNPSDLSNVYCSEFIIKNNRLYYENYGEYQRESFFYNILGTSYRLTFPEMNENIGVLLDKEGQKPNLPEFFLETIIEKGAGLAYISEQFITCLRNYPEKRSNNLVLLDLSSKKVLSKPIHSVRNIIDSGCVYGLDRKTKAVFKLNLELDFIWSNKIDFVNTNSLLTYAFLYNKSLITYLGPDEIKKGMDSGIPFSKYSGGYLTAFDDIRGSIIWKTEIPRAVDDIKQSEAKLFVASISDILVIDATTGCLIQMINTYTSTPINRDRAINLYLDDKYIYFTNTEVGDMRIYSISTYELIKLITLPVGYAFGKHEYSDPITKCHYFNIINSTQYVSRWCIVQINPNDLNDEISLESEPEHTINLVSSAERTDELELEIKLNNASLDDALRFGEIYTRDHCQWHSHSAVGMSFVGREANPNFNGIIRFIYSGSEKPGGVVKEHLAIMEKRFARWVDGEGFYAQPTTSNKNELSRLIAVYQ